MGMVYGEGTVWCGCCVVVGGCCWCYGVVVAVVVAGVVVVGLGYGWWSVHVICPPCVCCGVLYCGVSLGVNRGVEVYLCVVWMGVGCAVSVCVVCWG